MLFCSLSVCEESVGESECPNLLFLSSVTKPRMVLGPPWAL
uniref:Uncharacterized protein n=1 Tax=Anguilla anguilla TaxID=7936 RepID=A0A0E9SAY1_ANGAN